MNDVFIILQIDFYKSYKDSQSSQRCCSRLWVQHDLSKWIRRRLVYSYKSASIGLPSEMEGDLKGVRVGGTVKMDDEYNPHELVLKDLEQDLQSVFFKVNLYKDKNSNILKVKFNTIF